MRDAVDSAIGTVEAGLADLLDGRRSGAMKQIHFVWLLVLLDHVLLVDHVLAEKHLVLNSFQRLRDEMTRMS